MTHTHQHQAEVLEERMGLKIAARLAEASESVSHDIAQRLRHARTQALSRRKRPQADAATVSMTSGSLVALGGPSGAHGPWWQRMGLLLPVLALLIGLPVIDRTMDDQAAQDIAKLDAALLIDDLPPAAYADPGFLQFLRVYRDASR